MRQRVRGCPLIKLHSNMRRLLSCGSLVCATFMAGAGAAAATAPGDWDNYGRDAGGARSSPLTQITKSNVGELRQAWVYHMRPPGTKAEVLPGMESAPARFNTGFAASEASPLVANGVMYLPTP